MDSTMNSFYAGKAENLSWSFPVLRTTWKADLDDYYNLDTSQLLLIISLCLRQTLYKAAIPIPCVICLYLVYELHANTE